MSAQEFEEGEVSSPKNVLYSDDQRGQSISDSEMSKCTGAAQVTIQLPEGMQSNSISQQKMQELIMHLSQSGQLKDDGKIIIEVKGNLKPTEDLKSINSETKSVEYPPSAAQTPTLGVASPVKGPMRYGAFQHGSSPMTPKTAVIRSVNGPTQVKVAVLQNQTGPLTPVPSELKPVTTYQLALSTPSNGQTQQQTTMAAANTSASQVQQPAYIIIPTSQHATASPALATTNNTPIRVVSQGNQHIIHQQANTIATSPSVTGVGSCVSSTPISSFSLKSAGILKDGDRSVVVVHAHQHQNPMDILPVRTFTTAHNNRLPPAPPAIAAAANAAAAAAAAASFSGTATSGNTSVRLSRGGSLGSVGKESSWQQYVKQFEKLGPCPICGDKISGYHYGIFCCESCKGFFKRTVQNAKRYACHMATPSSLCDITATSRKKCPACRFVKCLEKGMRMEAIRTDRTRGGRSMYPGSRYLRQLAARASGGGSGDLKSGDSKSVGGGGSAGGGSGPLQPIAPLPHSASETVQIMSVSAGGGGAVTYGIPASEDVGGGVYLDPAILEDTGAPASTVVFHGDAEASAATVYRLPIRVSEQMDMPKFLRDIIKVEETIEAEPEERLDFDNPGAGSTNPDGTLASAGGPSGNLPPSVTEEEAAVYRALLNLADQRLYRIVRWSRALPVFSNLDTDDQILLLQNCWADLLCLDCCWKSLPTPAEIRLTSTKCINLDAAREMGAEELVDSLLRLTQDLKRLRFGLIDFACLKVFLLMQYDLANLKAVHQVKQFQECVSQILMEHNASTFTDVPNKFKELLVRIPELQRTSAMARDLLVDKDLSPYLSANSLLMELLRSDFHRHPSSIMPESDDSVPMETGEVAVAPTRSTTAASHVTQDGLEGGHHGLPGSRSNGYVGNC